MLKQKVKQKLNVNKTKNVAIFIGEGMELGTKKAIRTYLRAFV